MRKLRFGEVTWLVQGCGTLVAELGVMVRAPDSLLGAYVTQYETVIETGKNKYFLSNRRHRAGIRVDGSRSWTEF